MSGLPRTTFLCPALQTAMNFVTKKEAVKEGGETQGFQIVVPQTFASRKENVNGLCMFHGNNTDERHSSLTSVSLRRRPIFVRDAGQAINSFASGRRLSTRLPKTSVTFQAYYPDLGTEAIPLRSFPKQQTNNLSDDCHLRTLELLTHMAGKWMRD